MRHTQTILICLLFATTLLLNACGAGTSGYKLPQWDFNKQTQTKAEAPPKDLAETGTLAQPIATDPALAQQAIVQPVKVAILLPLTGQHGALGQSMLKSAQMALFDIAQDNFQLVPLDTQGTSYGARDAAQQAINQGAQLILGPVFANSVRSVRSVARPRNINVIAFTTDWSVVGDNVFTLGFLPFDQIERILDYAAQNGYKRVGVIAPKTTYGSAVISGAESIAPWVGIEEVSAYSFSPQTSNLSPGLRDFTRYDERTAEAETMLRVELLEKSKAKGVKADFDTDITPLAIQKMKAKLGPPFDAVLIAAGRENAIAISNLLSHYDLTPRAVKRLGTGLFDDPSLTGEIALNGAWFAAASQAQNQSFQTRYQELYATPAPRLASLAYDATALAAVLSQRNTAIYGAPVFPRESIINPNGFAGTDGIFRFLENGTVERGLSVLEFKSGHIAEVDPAPATFEKKKR